MTSTQKLLVIVKRNGGDSDALFTTLSSVWKNVEEWGTPEQKEMSAIGWIIWEAWNRTSVQMQKRWEDVGYPPVLFWGKVDGYGDEDDWMPVDLTEGPWGVQVIGSDVPFDLIDLGEPIIRGQVQEAPAKVLDHAS